MTKPAEVEVLSCGYGAKCSVPWCRRRATTILRCLDAQGRPYRQANVCESHAQELCTGLKVIDRKRGAPNRIAVHEAPSRPGCVVLWYLKKRTERRHRAIATAPSEKGECRGPCDHHPSPAERTLPPTRT